MMSDILTGTSVHDPRLMGRKLDLRWESSRLQGGPVAEVRIHPRTDAQHLGVHGFGREDDGDDRDPAGQDTVAADERAPGQRGPGAEGIGAG